MRRVALVLACLALTSPARADVPAGSQILSAGAVTATLSWQRGDFATAPTLRITRAGAIALDTTLVAHCKACVSIEPPGHALHVLDLDGDGEPEVIVDGWTEGAHCCLRSVIFAWAGDHYGRLVHDFGNVGYRLRDLDGDGRPELVSADDAFAYAFTDYGHSDFPLLVLAYGTDRSGRTDLRDVTVRYRSAIAADAAVHLRRLRQVGDDRRGVIAAYVADEYRLGKVAQAERFLRQALRRHRLRGPGPGPRDRRFIVALHRFLRARGYVA